MHYVVYGMLHDTVGNVNFSKLDLGVLPLHSHFKDTYMWITVLGIKYERNGNIS